MKILVIGGAGYIGSHVVKALGEKGYDILVVDSFVNCGYEHGYSVKEVIDTAKKVTGVDFMVEESDRRPGDPAILVADSSKLKTKLGWKPRFDDLEYIVRTAWNWELNRRF